MPVAVHLALKKFLCGGLGVLKNLYHVLKLKEKSTATVLKMTGQIG